MLVELHPPQIVQKSNAPGQVSGDAVRIRQRKCSIRTPVSPKLVVTIQELLCGECRRDYIDCKSPGRGFESRQVHHWGPVAQQVEQEIISSNPCRRDFSFEIWNSKLFENAGECRRDYMVSKEVRILPGDQR